MFGGDFEVVKITFVIFIITLKHDFNHLKPILMIRKLHRNNWMDYYIFVNIG